MIGILSFGTYIPVRRLNRVEITEGLSGEKAVAGFDEDSITMAVAATMDCLKGFDRQQVDGLFLATTTSPYKEKLGAAIVATASDLRRDIITADFSNSLRAGTIALRSAIDAVKSGSVKQVLVVAADCRLGAPGSNQELYCSDGAVAFLIGISDERIAEIEAFYSVCDEILDVWRSEGDQFIRSADGRFITDEGYVRVCKEAISGLMNNSNLNKNNFNKAIFGIPDPRAQIVLAKDFQFDVKTQLQDSMFSQLGDSGVAYSLMLLQAALEDAKANDRLLLVSYGNGSDAISLKVTGRIEGRGKTHGILRSLESKRYIDYKSYAIFRGLLPIVRPSRPLGEASPMALWREVEHNIRLYGVKCNVCGTVQYPPQRVCTKCHTKDQFEKIRLSDKRGNLYTYSIDYIGWAPEMPTVTAIVNFEGGGRIQCYMSDAKVDELNIGMPLEMSFRKIDFREGINIYSWKCIHDKAETIGTGD